MPIDKKKLNGLLEDIKEDLKKLEKKPPKVKISSTHAIHPKTVDTELSPVKKSFLLPTEKKAYFQINHYYKLTLMSIEDFSTALTVWTSGVLLRLLVLHSIDLEEWERLCELGNADSQLGEELVEDWKEFFKGTVIQGKIDNEILFLLNEGRKRVKEKPKEQ